MVRETHNGAATTARTRTLEAQIKRFAKSRQRRLRRLVKTSSRLGDLLYTFPAAAFAVVSGRGDHNQRGAAIDCVKTGGSLRQVAEILELPWWLRQLPPEAFGRPFGPLPDGAAFSRKIVNAIPDDDAIVPMWFEWVQVGHEVCHADFALWLARQKIYHPREGVGAPVLPLAAYAWFSSREKDERTRRLVDNPWHRQIGWRRAITNTVAWYERVVRELTLADRRRGPGRSRNRVSGKGFRMMPLRTPQELFVEGEVMNHCVAGYAAMVARGECLIFSVRHGGNRVATLELRWLQGRHMAPAVVQLLGPSNAPVAPEVAEAVNLWLHSQSGWAVFHPGSIAQLRLDETRWRAVWARYIAEKGALVNVPERPSAELVLDLSRDMQLLMQTA